MRKSITVGLAVSALVAAAAAIAGPAHAAPTPGASPAAETEEQIRQRIAAKEALDAHSNQNVPDTGQSIAAACQPGNFCAWTGTYRGGSDRQWGGNSTRWPDFIRNNAQSVENNGVPHPKERVAMFYAGDNQGAVKDIARGNWYLDLTLCWERFDRDAGRGIAGMGQCINRNVASHWWW